MELKLGVFLHPPPLSPKKASVFIQENKKLQSIFVLYGPLAFGSLSIGSQVPYKKNLSRETCDFFFIRWNGEVRPLHLKILTIQQYVHCILPTTIVRLGYKD